MLNSLTGCGLLRMHVYVFLGMIACELSWSGGGVEFFFEPGITALSAVVSVLAVAFGFWFVSLNKEGLVSFARLALGGLFVGGGVSVMHYTGI